MREKKEMKEGRGACTKRERMRDVSTNTRTERYTHTHTQHTHINVSPMAGTVPYQGPGTG